MTPAPTPRPAPVVALAVATYRRPGLLEALLPALVVQASNVPGAFVVIVDNDPDESARAVVAAYPEVRYAAEPRPGIAAARNRALDLAREGGAVAVVFLDDDEEPLDEWLATLVAAWVEFGSAGVSGPVLSEFAGPIDAWTESAPTFRRTRLATGSLKQGAATNNLLLDLAVLATEDVRFDDAFGLTGGSDTLLTRTLTGRGREIRWCDEAVVREVVPVERATREWVLRRCVRTGNVWSRVQLELAQRRRWVVQVRLIVLGLGHIVRGWRRIVAGRVRRDLPTRVLGECDLATARGVLRGSLGSTVVEYLRTG